MECDKNFNFEMLNTNYWIKYTHLSSIVYQTDLGYGLIMKIKSKTDYITDKDLISLEICTNDNKNLFNLYDIKIDLNKLKSRCVYDYIDSRIGGLSNETK